MKRSLFIAIAVLIVMALFVGCKAEIADRDELGMVSISDTSRTLSASAELTADVENLYWYYTAAKADESLFTTGATTEKTAVKTGVGLSGAKLASRFSTGAWTFCFYGYENEYDSSSTTQKPVYYQEGLAVTVARNTTVYLTVTLSQGDGLAAPTLAIDGATWSYANAGGKTLFLRVFDGDSTTPIVEIEADASSAGIATFNTENDYEFTAAGAHTLSFKVYYGAQLVGETTPIELITRNGFKYTITDLNAASAGIETLDETGEIVISGSYNADTGSAAAVGSVTATAGENTITATIAPSTATAEATETETTTVSFPAGVLAENTNYTLDLEVTPAATANSSFTVTSGAAVAGINLNLAAGTTPVTQFSDYVTVTTNVGAGLGTVTVEYNGSEFINGENGEKYYVDYDNDDGTLIFKTNHFSEFVVVSKSAEAMIGSTAYTTVAGALAAVPTDGTATTIVLLKDATAETLAINSGMNVVLDLGGHKLTAGAYVYNGSLIVKNGTICGMINVYPFATDNTGMVSHLTIDADATVDASYSVILRESPNTKKGYDAVIDINGTLTGWIWVMGNINNDEGDCVINVNNGANTANIALQGYAILNINEGATVTGPASKAESAIEVRSGILNVNGGTITCNYKPTEAEMNNNGTSTRGAGVGISQYNNNSIEVYFYDGVITGHTGVYWTHTYATQTRPTYVEANGGSFASTVENGNKWFIDTDYVDFDDFYDADNGVLFNTLLDNAQVTGGLGIEGGAW